MKRDDALAFLSRHIPLAFPGADTALLCGSTAQDKAQPGSDIDVIVLFDSLPEGAWRLTDERDGIQVEAFVHDLGTLGYFIREVDALVGSKTLAGMVVEGVPVPGLGNRLVDEAKRLADHCIAAGPPPLDTATRERQRYLIGGLLDDLKDDRSRHERHAIAAALYVQLAHFVLRAAGRFVGEGKGLARALEAHDPTLAALVDSAFASFHATGDTDLLNTAVDRALAPHGGRIGPRYFAQAPAAWRLPPE